MSDLVVYEKRSCTKCRDLSALLGARGVDFDRVDFHVEPLPEPKLRELLGKAGLRPVEALRKREEAYAEHVAGRDLGDDELFALMAAHPQLLQRPIVERGDRAVLARPTERVLDLL